MGTGSSGLVSNWFRGVFPGGSEAISRHRSCIRLDFGCERRNSSSSLLYSLSSLGMLVSIVSPLFPTSFSMSDDMEAGRFVSLADMKRNEMPGQIHTLRLG